jgi:hypothetical protein
MHKKFNDLESVTEQISRTWLLSALICQAPNLYSLNYLIGFFEIRKHILSFLKKKSQTFIMQEYITSDPPTPSLSSMYNLNHKKKVCILRIAIAIS